MEFAEYREYQPGDDARHIDRFVHARSGQHHVRRFHVDQQLHALIVVDASPSMRFGSPSKYEHALKLAATLAYVMVSGGDRAVVGVTHGTGVRWFQAVTRSHQMVRLTSWLGVTEADGDATLADVVRSMTTQAKRPSVAIVISDWMFDDHATPLRMLRAQGHEVVGIQVLSEEERDPAALGTGAVWLVDGEGAGSFPAVLSSVARQRYLDAFETWQAEIRRDVQAAQGRYFLTTTSDDVESLFVQEWRVSGLIQ